MHKATILLLLLAGRVFPSTPARFVPLYIHDSALRVELADTVERQIRGLMYRTSLAPDCGMLFVFDDDQPRSFWMKNTLIALDIIFLNADKQVISMHRDVPPCRRDPCPSYESGIPAR